MWWKKESKAERKSNPKQQDQGKTREPPSPLTKDFGGPVTEAVPFALFEAAPADDPRSRQEIRHAIRAKLLAPEGSSPVSPISQQNDDFGEKGIDLKTALSLLEQLKRTASPDDLIALQRALQVLPMKPPSQDSTPSDYNDEFPTPGSEEVPQLGGHGVGTLVVRNGAASPTTTVDSADLLRRLSGEGPTSWVVDSYMSALSAARTEEPQHLRNVESTSTVGEPPALKQIHRPVTRRSGSLKGRELRTRDSVSLASEYMAEIGPSSSNSNPARPSYEISARPSYETSTRPSYEIPTRPSYEISTRSSAVSSYHSIARSSLRSSGISSRDSLARSTGGPRSPAMHGRFSDTASSIIHNEPKEMHAVSEAPVSGEGLSGRAPLRNQSSNAALKSALRTRTSFVTMKSDSGYASSCSNYRTSQDTFSEGPQSCPASRNHSTVNLPAAESTERKITPVEVSQPPKSTERKITPAETPQPKKDTAPRKSKSQDKAEKLAGESHAYLKFPIIGNNTQKVILPKSSRSQIKIEKMTGESLESLSYPVVGVVPQFQANTRTLRRLEGRKSEESMADSEMSEPGEGGLKRSRSWKKSTRESRSKSSRSAPTSRASSPERESLAKEEPMSLSKQRKKLQKRRPVSKDFTRAQTIDDVPRVPSPVKSRFQKRIATSPGMEFVEQTSEEAIASTSKLVSARDSTAFQSTATVATYFSERESFIEPANPTLTLKRRPSFLRRGRKQNTEPEEDYELNGVLPFGSALGGTPYDIAMSEGTKKLLEKQRSSSAGPTHPHHFANVSPNVSRPGSREGLATKKASRKASRRKRLHTSQTHPRPSAERPRPVSEIVEEDVEPPRKRESVWNRELIAAMNKGLPAELPAQLRTERPIISPADSVETPADLSTEMISLEPEEVPPQSPVELPAVVPVELPAVVPVELSADPPSLEDRQSNVQQVLPLWKREQRPQNVVYSLPNFSSPFMHAPRPMPPSTRPASSPATTIFSASKSRPAITLTSASPSPPPSPTMEAQRPNSLGNLSNSWKKTRRISISPEVERETAEWSRQAEIWRERLQQARDNVQTAAADQVKISGARTIAPPPREPAVPGSVAVNREKPKIAAGLTPPTVVPSSDASAMEKTQTWREKLQQSRANVKAASAAAEKAKVASANTIAPPPALTMDSVRASASIEDLASRPIPKKSFTAPASMNVPGPVQNPTMGKVVMPVPVLTAESGSGTFQPTPIQTIAATASAITSIPALMVDPDDGSLPILHTQDIATKSASTVAHASAKVSQPSILQTAATARAITPTLVLTAQSGSGAFQSTTKHQIISTRLGTPSNILKGEKSQSTPNPVSRTQSEPSNASSAQEPTSIHTLKPASTATRENTTPSPTLRVDSPGGKHRDRRSMTSNNSYTSSSSSASRQNRDTKSSRRNFGVLYKTARVAAM